MPDCVIIESDPNLESSEEGEKDYYAEENKYDWFQLVWCKHPVDNGNCRHTLSTQLSAST